MPHEVTHQIRTEAVRKGDRLLLVDGETSSSISGGRIDEITIETVKIGRTQATFGVAEMSRPVSVALDQTVTVVRTEATPEEKAAVEREYAIEEVTQQIARAHKSSPVHELAAKLTEDAEKGYCSPVFEVLKWHADKIIAAETTKELWEAVEVVQTNTGKSLADSFVVWYEETLRTAAFGYPGDTWSGRVSNDLIRCQNEARQVWLRDNEFSYTRLAGRSITAKGNR